MDKAIKILKDELKTVEYLYKNYERAKVLKYVDAENMQKKIDALKYTIEILERKS